LRPDLINTVVAIIFNGVVVMSGPLTIEEAERLQEALDKISAAIEKLNQESEEKASYFDVLSEVHRIIVDYDEVISKVPDIYTSLIDLEYSLAYNALVDGAPPTVIMPNVDETVWDRIMENGVIDIAAKYYVIDAVVSGDFEKARDVYSIYENYISDDVKTYLAGFLAPEVEQLLSAIASGDYSTIYTTIRNIEQAGKSERVKSVLSEFGLDFDEIRENTYRWQVYEVLVSSTGPDDAIAKLEEAGLYAEVGGLSDLLYDLETASQAIVFAKQGNIEGFVGAISSISDEAVHQFAVVRGLALLYNGHPEVLIDADEAMLQRLQEEAKRAGYDIDLMELATSMEALMLANELVAMVNDGRYQDALDYWSRISDEKRNIIASFLGLEPDRIEAMLNEVIEVTHIAGMAKELAGFLNNGDYIDAFNYWSNLERESQEKIASMLGESWEDLDAAIRIAAGMQAVSGLEKPMLDQIKEVLAVYVGEEKAAEIARQLLEETPTYKAKMMIDSGKYVEALDYILESDMVGDERKMMIFYLLATIEENMGTKGLAMFMQEYGDRLEGYAPSGLKDAITLYFEAPIIAATVVKEIQDAIADATAEKVQGIVDEFQRALEAGNFAKAKLIIEANRSLLQDIVVDNRSLYTILTTALTVTEIVSNIDKMAKRLDDIYSSEGGAPDAISEASNIARQANVMINTIQELDIDQETKNGLINALKLLTSYAYAFMAIEDLKDGKYNLALNAAEHAYKLNPELKDLYDTVIVLKSTIGNRNKLMRNIMCILDKVAGITNTSQAGGGGGRIEGSKHIK